MQIYKESLEIEEADMSKATINYLLNNFLR